MNVTFICFGCIYYVNAGRTKILEHLSNLIMKIKSSIIKNMSDLQNIIWNSFESIIKIGLCAFFNMYAYNLKVKSQSFTKQKAQIT